MLIRTSVLLAAFALVAAACSTSSDTTTTVAGQDTTTSTTSTTSTTVADTTTTVPDDGFPVTIAADNGDVTIEARPVRIVSISPTATEVLFAVGAGDQVVAVDSLSTFPEGTPATDLSAFTPNVEAIAAYDPDLVFLSFDPGDVIAGLEAIGIPVILHGTAFDLATAYAQWEQTGAATGNLAEAVLLVANTQAALGQAYDSVGTTGEGLSYYYEIDTFYYTATSASFFGQLLAPLGIENIADEAPDPDGWGYPMLSEEYIIDADPDLILLANTVCCGQSAETVAARPGWETLTAVATGSIVELDDDVASRWGPRIVELVESVAVAINELVAANA